MCRYMAHHCHHHCQIYHNDFVADGCDNRDNDDSMPAMMNYYSFIIICENDFSYSSYSHTKQQQQRQQQHQQRQQ